MSPIILFAQVIIRSLSAIVTFLFGWIITTFSGNLPTSIARGLTVIAVLGGLWWYLVISVLWPPIFRVVTQVAPQLAPRHALILALTWPSLLLIPLIAGGVLLYMRGVPLRPLRSALPILWQGLQTTVGYGLAIPFMLVSAAARVGAIYLYRLQTEHLPIQLHPDGYPQVLHDLHTTLRAAGYPMTLQHSAWTLRLPAWLLARLAPSLLPYVIAEEAYALVGTAHRLSITVHPYDIMIIGRDDTPSAVHVALMAGPPFTGAYWTWDPIAHAFEDRMRALEQRWSAASPSERENLATAVHDLQQEVLALRTISYADWMVLSHLVMRQVECMRESRQ